MFWGNEMASTFAASAVLLVGLSLLAGFDAEAQSTTARDDLTLIDARPGP